ncbi:MAG TPA: ABC transporter ATP-binding protein [Spirochaetota bacterium]|nr:ABC transporter ATP-binding protein [Spirochaetota bacterium]HQE60438.1 ABC transporter ATP-binding protein [Spirochaetota bacterium]
MSFIKAKGINKHFGFGKNTLNVLTDVSFEIEQGENVSIVGPSGAGKSTLLNLIGCLDYFQSGNLFIGGKNISSLSISEISKFRNRNLGFIFQANNLLPEFSALENVMIPLLVRRTSPKKAKNKALELIEKFGLLDRIHHKPSELSGGECQRITVARALAGDPSIILADEPTGALDRKNSENLMDFLFSLAKEKNCTLITVTHDQSIAAKTGRIITLIDGKIANGGQHEN